MKDKDTMLLENAYGSIFSGHVDEEKDEDIVKDETEECDKEEKEESKKIDDEESDEESDDESDDEESDDEESDDESDEEESDDEESDDESDDEESDEESDDESDEEESDDESDDEAGGDKGVQSKIKTLQKQYNDIMTDAFTKYAPDCIQNALDSSEGSFGEDIESVLQSALDELKGKILGDFGIESSMNIESEPMAIDALSSLAGSEDSEDDSEEDTFIEFGEPKEESCGMKHYKKKKKK